MFSSIQSRNTKREFLERLFGEKALRTFDEKYLEFLISRNLKLSLASSILIACILPLFGASPEISLLALPILFILILAGTLADSRGDLESYMLDLELSLPLVEAYRRALEDLGVGARRSEIESLSGYDSVLARGLLLSILSYGSPRSRSMILWPRRRELRDLKDILEARLEGLELRNILATIFWTMIPLAITIAILVAGYSENLAILSIPIFLHMIYRFGDRFFSEEMLLEKLE